MYDYVFGIDPGTQTGIALWIPKKKSFEFIETQLIHKALDIVKEWSLKPTCHTDSSSPYILLRIENPNTWIPYGKKQDTGLLQGAGSIKRDFKIWKDFAKYYGLDVEPVSLRAAVKKIKSEDFVKLTQWEKRTSQHARDAAMLCFDYNHKKK